MKKKILFAILTVVFSVLLFGILNASAATTETVYNTTMFQSPHPYYNNTDKYWHYIHNNPVDWLKITFSESTQTYDYNDYIYVYDGSDKYITSGYGTSFAGKTITVNDDSVKVRLRTNSTSTAYGFKVSSVEGGYDSFVETSDISKMQSPHPYGNYMEKTWIYRHPYDAAFLDVTFSADTVIDNSYNNADYLYIYDRENKLIGRYNGSSLAGTTLRLKDNVVKIKLGTNGVYTANGFKVSKIEAIGENCVRTSDFEKMQSSHLYPHNMDKTYVYEHPFDVDSMTVTFSENTKTQAGYDFIYLYDQTGSELGKYTGTELAGSSITVTGHILAIRMTSDSSGNDYGFKIDNVEAPEIAETKSSGSLGKTAAWRYNSGTLYISGYGKMPNYKWQLPLAAPYTPWHNHSMYLDRSIKNIVVREGISHIGTAVFYACVVETAVIPRSVRTIGAEAFQSCGRLKFVEYGGSRAEWERVEIGESNDALNNANISFSCTDKYYTVADRNNRHITSISYREKSDGTILITDASNLFNGVIPEKIEGKNVSEIGYMALSEISGNIYIPKTVTFINKNAFKDGATIGFPGTEEQWNNIEIEERETTLEGRTVLFGGQEGDFRYCIDGEDVIIVDSKETVSGKIEIPEEIEGKTVKEINTGVFFSRKNITEVTVPETVTKFGEMVFYNCTSLKNVSLPEKVSDGENFNSMFYYCTSLTSIKIPEGVKTLDSAFYNCSKLVTAELPDGISDMMAAFYNCKSLVNVNIPAGLSYLYNTFCGCESLKSMELPEGMEFLFWAFQNCKNLETITIPASIREMYSTVSSYGVKTVYYNGTPERWAEITKEDNSFDNAEKIFFWYAEFIDENGNNIKTDKVIINTAADYSDIPLRRDEDIVFYSDADKTEIFDITKSLTQNTTLYFERYYSLKNRVKITGEESGCVGEAFGRALSFATDKNASIAYFFIKYPDTLSLKSVAAKDFYYAEKEDEYTEGGFTTAVIVTQYSETELIPVNTIYTPFELAFDISESAKPGEVYIEVTEESCLIGNETFFFEDRIEGTLEILPKLAESVEIVGEDVISSEATYSAIVSPDYTTDKSVEWSVDDETIATVSESGVVTPVTSGTFTLTATAKDGSGVYGTKTVTVTRFVENIEIAGPDSIKEEASYTVKVFPDYATEKEVEWSVSDNSIATVSENGAVTPVTSGFVTVKATATDGSGVYATKEILVIKLAESIEITGEDSISSPAQYFAKVLPDYTSDKEVVWSVDNTDIATVDESGIVTPVTSGSVVLTATAADGSGVYASKSVEIIRYAESIEIVGEEEISVPTLYSVVILPEYTTDKSVIWSVSDEEVATVDENGLVTPLKNGKIVLTAKAVDASGIETTKSVVITVNVRANSIITDVGEWDREFDSDITEYTVYVPEKTSQIYFTTTLENATVKVNGSLAGNGMRKKVNLEERETEVKIQLIPQSGNILKENIYSITVIRGSFTKTAVSDDKSTFTVEPINLEHGKTVILALYDGNKFAQMQSAVYEGEKLVFNTLALYTTAKVMVWDMLESLKPFCKTEIVE